MANTKTAKKEIRASRHKQARGKPVRTLCKSSITKAEKLLFTGEAEEARKQVAAAISTLDRAAERGIIHPNNAARRKSRLMQKLNSAQKQTETKAESTEKQ